MILYFSVDAPHRWVILDRRNRVLEEGLAESLDHIPIRHRRLTRRVGVVRGELVTIHGIRIPARSRAKAEAAAPYMLEEFLASGVEDLEFRLLKWVRGGVSKVAVMSHETAEEWRRKLTEFPEHVDALVPDYLLLPRHTESRATVAADGKGRILIRTGELDGLVIADQDLPLWWEEMSRSNTPVAVNHPDHARFLVEHGGAMVSEWRIGEHFGRWLQHGHQVPENVDLLEGGRDADGGPAAAGWLKAAAALVLLALALRVGVDGYDYVTLGAREDRLNREMEQVLTQAFPDISRVVAPRTQMAQRLADLRGRAFGGGFLSMLSVVAEAVPAGSATVEEITFRDETLLVTCSTRDFEALDRLKRQFDADGRVSTELVSSGSREDSVSGRFKLNLRPG